MSVGGVLVRHVLAVLWKKPGVWAFLLLSSLGLGMMTYFFSQTAEPDLLGKNAMLQRLVELLLVVGLVVVSLHGADAFSGERERGTLEVTLLAPVKGTQILFAKGVAAMSLWFAIILVGIPYAWVLSFDPNSFRRAVAILLVPGTFLSIMMAGLALAVSARSPDNRRSMAISLGVLLALFGPTLVPRLDQVPLGVWLLRVDPVSSVAGIIGTVLVRGDSWASAAEWVLSPVLAAVLVGWFAWRSGRKIALDPGVTH